MEDRELGAICALTADGRHALDGDGRCWDVAQGTWNKTVDRRLRLISAAGNRGWVAIDADGHIGQVRPDGRQHWSSGTVSAGFSCMAAVTGNAWTVIVDGDHSGGHVYCTTSHEAALLWERRVFRGEYMSLAVAPDTRAWLVGCNTFHKFPISVIEGDLLVMEAMTGDGVAGTLVKIEHGVARVAWHPRGDLVAVGTFAGDVELRKHNGRELVCSWPADEGRIVHLSFTGDGRGLVTVGEHARLKVRAIRPKSEPPLPLVYAQPLDGVLLDLVCPAGGGQIVMAGRPGSFTVLELPDALWTQPPIGEKSLPPSFERAVAAGDRLYGSIEGQADAVLQDIATDVQFRLVQPFVPPEALDIIGESERAHDLRKGGDIQDAILLYLEINDRITRLLQHRSEVPAATVTSLLNVQVRVIFFAGLEMMYLAGVEERLRPWNDVPPTNPELFRALDLLKECERIVRGLAPGAEIDTDYWHIYVELGNLYHCMRKREASIESYTKSLQGDTTARQRSLTYFNRARVYLQTSDYENAIADYGAAEDEGFDPPGVPSYNAACAHALAGRTGKAVEMLRRAAAKGYPSRAKAAADSDFDSIRHDAELVRYLSTP